MYLDIYINLYSVIHYVDMRQLGGCACVVRLLLSMKPLSRVSLSSLVRLTHGVVIVMTKNLEYVHTIFILHGFSHARKSESTGIFLGFLRLFGLSRLKKSLFLSARHVWN